MTKDQIIELIKKNEQIQVKDLIQILGLTKAAIHRALNILVERKQIAKKGSPPKVFYFLVKENQPLEKLDIPPESSEILEENYLYIDPTGKIKAGIEGFLAWMSATKNKQKIENCINDYLSVLKEAQSHKNKDGLIDATERFDNVFSKNYLDKIFYYDFYSLIKFGKTKIGQYLLHGKQAQDKKIIKDITGVIKKPLFDLIKIEKVDAIAWTPHSIPRKIQFLKEIEKNLGLGLPTIQMVKAYSGAIPIAQKSLSKIEERIQNAAETMVIVPLEINHKKVLLIDDAVGSGATMNEIAKKLKKKGAKTVIGFSIVGSYKGFEVIKEV